MPERRVLFVAPRFPSISGGATVIANLRAAFLRADVDSEVVSVYPGDEPSDSTVLFSNETIQRHPVRESDASLCSLPFLVVRKRVERWLGLHRLRRAVERLTDDDIVIFTHVLGKQLLDESGYTRPQDPSPLFIGQHHSSFESLEDEPWLREALPAHFRDCDFFVALTERDAQLFGPLLNIRSVAIPNPARPTRAVGDPRSRRAIALARFSHEKQLPLMVQMFAEAATAPEGDGWTLTIYGEGESQPEIERAIADAQCGSCIRLAGPTHDVDSVLDGAALNLVTSHLEGFGMTILEASQAGIPTIAFDCSDGVHDQLALGGGWLVPRQDSAGYVAALRDAMGAPDDIGRRGENARRQAERYDAQAITHQWEKLWSESPSMSTQDG